MSYGDIYASVYILDAPYAIDREFDYFVPASLKGEVCPGRFVSVPFGGANKKRIGLVSALSSAPKCEGASIKSVDSVFPDTLSLDEKRLGLVFFLKEQTLCTVGEAVHAMIPSAAFARGTEYYRATEKTDALTWKNAKMTEVLDFIRSKKKASEKMLRDRFGADVKKLLSRLVSDGYAVREFRMGEPSSQLTRSVYSLSVSSDDAEKILAGQPGVPVRLRSEGQKKAISALLASDDGVLSREEMSSAGVSAAALKSLVEKGLIAEEKQIVYRNPYASGETCAEREPIHLSEEQEKAFSELKKLSDTGEAQAALLHGVTGSGKTSVMMSLIDHVLDVGKSVILLLPEISLTPQTIGIFCRRYGDLCAVVHSALSAGERYDAYIRILRGEARVVIGTRSAVFSPVRDLGLIVIDEEQETTYKSDQNPKYHARDAARYRCATEKALMLLASATPSLESYLKAKEGKYSLIKLKERYGGARLPLVTVADMRGEASKGNVSPIGEMLTSDLIATKGDGEQSILFINRRGYNTFVSCRTCGEAVTCPRCSVSMTYHTSDAAYKSGYLACHWCGYRAALPKVCPSCGSEHLAHMGYGTQRIEQELCELVPGARVLRMDTDTTSTKFSYDKILGTFRAGEADILLGTQMVTKGHDFPKVTLVGVLLADASLYLDDYRASERTFSLLTQVIGRAGRASDKGRAVIQTNNPDHDVIKLAAAQDYETFFEREIKLRRLLVFPPFCDIVLVTVSSANETDLFVATEKLKKFFDGKTAPDGEFSDVKTLAFGPFEAPVYKVEGRFRMRMVIKCRLNKRSRALFSSLLCHFSDEGTSGYSKGAKKPVVSIDFNPSSL